MDSRGVEKHIRGGRDYGTEMSSGLIRLTVDSRFESVVEKDLRKS